MKQLISIFLILIGFFANATEVELKASLSSNVVSIGQRFQISFTINSSASDFHPPSFSDFRILAGPNQSRNMQYINGRMSSSSTWSYILMPTKEGVFTIPPASVNVDGNILQSNSVEIRIVNTGEPANANSAPQPHNRQRAQPSINTSEKVFIRATVDKTEAYLGEKITATYKLYTKVGIADNTLETLPSLTGFWSHDLKSLYGDAEWKVEVINGQRYNSAILVSTLLYPQRTGELTVDAMSMKMQIQVSGSGNSLFDRMFGNYETKEVEIKSNEIKIKVKPLPKKDKPMNFSGAVGSFDLVRDFSTDSLKANDALNLKITVSGKGNIKLLDAPKLELPADFEVYDPEIKDNFTTNSTGISGSRTFEYLIIPRHEGDFIIEPLRFSYFDLASESYKTITTDSAVIHVSPANKSSNQLYSSVNKEEVELLNRDIAYIHEDNLDLRSTKRGFFGSFLFYLLMFIPLLFIVFLYFYRKSDKERKKDIAGLRKNRAKKIAKKRLTTAKKHLSAGDKTSFHEEISAALFGYYSDKFNLSLSELSQEKIVAAMEDRGANEGLVQKLKQILDEADMARFAPPSDRDDQTMYQKAEEVIITSEEELS